MSIGISVSARINASSSETWTALENIDSHVQWMKDAESVHFTAAGRTRTGTEFVCVTTVGPIRLTDAMSITEWTPCDAMDVHHRGKLNNLALGDGEAYDPSSQKGFAVPNIPCGSPGGPTLLWTGESVFYFGLAGAQNWTSCAAILVPSRHP
jgi:hypothetical protein